MFIDFLIDVNLYFIRLTAFVLRCFNQAKNYITIDKNVLAKGANFLLNNQNKNGSFAV